MLKRIFYPVVMAGMLANFAATSAQAASVSIFDGTVTELTGATDVTADIHASDDIQYVLEAADRTLINAQNLTDPKDSQLAAGTVVNVYLVFLNSLSSGDISRTAGFEFGGEILGVITGTKPLNNTNNRYGGAGYGLLNGLEKFTTDSYGFTGNRLVTTMTNADGNGDWMRVFVSAAVNTRSDDQRQPLVGAEVPLPASGLLLGFGVAGIAAMRRKAKRG